MLRVTPLVMVMVLGSIAPAHALMLCAKVDKVTGELRDGSPIKLRSICKTKNDGTPLEVAIGTTDDLASTGAHAIVRRIALGVAESERDRRDLVARTEVQRNDITGRLSEVYATASAGVNAVTVDPTIASATLGELRTELQGMLADLTFFDRESLSDTVFTPDADAAAGAMNVWIAELNALDTVLLDRLDTAEAAAEAYEQAGKPMPVAEFLGGPAASNLEDLRSALESPTHDTSEAMLEEFSRTVRSTLDDQPDTVEQDAELADVDLQSLVQKLERTVQVISTVSKRFHDGAMGIVRNVGG